MRYSNKSCLVLIKDSTTYDHQMVKIKPGTLTVGTAENKFEGISERFLASDKAFSLISSVKGTPAYWKQFH